MAVVVKCAMTPYQAGIYNWVKTTGTLRLDPSHPLTGKAARTFVPLNNKVMELRKVRREDPGHWGADDADGVQLGWVLHWRVPWSCWDGWAAALHPNCCCWRCWEI